ncbi:MAG: rod shape-determining protein RodA [Steroidobacteraceae bacterium]|jgi:rod shape determining protein RodA|nr:rod shape-determining protein RodA [Steroidobacteraceae bacterium]
MAEFYEDSQSSARRTLSASGKLLRRLHLDGPLLALLAALMVFSLFVGYSASGENLTRWIDQVQRFGVAVVAMLVMAQLPPAWLRRISPVIYGLGIAMLLLVTTIGPVRMGAQRWLDIGPISFQPSELMKLAVPMMAAWYLHERPLPPSAKHLAIALLIIVVPAGLVIEQPDLGTGLLVASAGLFVVFLGGLSWWLIGAGAVVAPFAAWIGWHFLHDYQRQRVLTLLDPSQDPLGAGYHIIQSMIAIGSGGVFGKGWTNGSQAQLEFLPERSTDFVFAVIGEELGLLGQGLLLVLYLGVIGRALYMASECQDTFARLVSGAFALTFFVYVFVNAGMVAGILPVVGVPLPLVSYGGTSAVTLLASFGILMSLYRHRKLVGS